MAGETEQILFEVINSFYLAQPAPTASKLYRHIANRCAATGVPTPARTTVARRITRLGWLLVARRRAGANAVETITMVAHNKVDGETF